MPRAAKIQLTAAQQEELERCVASRTLPVRAAERVKIILGLAAGKAKQQIAKQLGIARQTVRRWEQRYLQQGTEKGLQDAPRSGRPRLIGPEKIQQIVHKTTQEAPLDSTHWSTRSLSQVLGVSASSVSRIWRAHQLKPHRVKTFQLSNDPQFAEKLEDTVELATAPASGLGGVVGRRTVPDSGTDPHATRPALRARPLCHPNAQLPASWDHHWLPPDRF